MVIDLILHYYTSPEKFSGYAPEQQQQQQQVKSSQVVFINNNQPIKSNISQRRLRRTCLQNPPGLKASFELSKTVHNVFVLEMRWQRALPNPSQTGWYSIKLPGWMEG